MLIRGTFVSETIAARHIAKKRNVRARFIEELDAQGLANDGRQRYAAILLEDVAEFVSDHGAPDSDPETELQWPADFRVLVGSTLRDIYDRCKALNREEIPWVFVTSFVDDNHWNNNHDWRECAPVRFDEIIDAVSNRVGDPDPRSMVMPRITLVPTLAYLRVPPPPADRHADGWSFRRVDCPGRQRMIVLDTGYAGYVQFTKRVIHSREFGGGWVPFGTRVLHSAAGHPFYTCLYANEIEWPVHSERLVPVVADVPFRTIGGEPPAAEFPDDNKARWLVGAQLLFPGLLTVPAYSFPTEADSLYVSSFRPMEDFETDRRRETPPDAGRIRKFLRRARLVRR